MKTSLSVIAVLSCLTAVGCGAEVDDTEEEVTGTTSQALSARGCTINAVTPDGWTSNGYQGRASVNCPRGNSQGTVSYTVKTRIKDTDGIWYGSGSDRNYSVSMNPETTIIRTDKSYWFYWPQVFWSDCGKVISKVTITSGGSGSSCKNLCGTTVTCPSGTN